MVFVAFLWDVSNVFFPRIFHFSNIVTWRCSWKCVFCFLLTAILSFLFCIFPGLLPRGLDGGRRDLGWNWTLRGSRLMGLGRWMGGMGWGKGGVSTFFLLWCFVLFGGGFVLFGCVVYSFGMFCIVWLIEKVKLQRSATNWILYIANNLKQAFSPPTSYQSMQCTSMRKPVLGGFCLAPCVYTSSALWSQRKIADFAAKQQRFIP